MYVKSAVLTATMLLALSGVVGAASHGRLDARWAARQADLVFKGTVESVDYALSDAAGRSLPDLPHTFVTYRVEKVFKGSTREDTVTLRFIGGRGKKAAFMMVSGLPLFDVGDRDILFVRDNGVSACPLVGCAAGRYRLIQGKVFSEEGQAVEQDADGVLRLRAYYDLPEVMTHKVSMTTLRRRDQLDEGEERRRFAPPGAGAHLDAPMLAARIRQALAGPGVRKGRLVASANRAKPFALAPIRSEAPPVVAATPVEARAKTRQELIEIEALRANGGNPVIDAKTLQQIRNAR